MKRHTRALALVAAVAAGLTAATPGPAAAQNADLPELLTFGGSFVRVRYVPGALDRSVHVQRRLDLLGEDFARWLGEKVLFDVFVLGRTEWKAARLNRPYGIPELAGDGVVLAAHGDPGTVELWRQILGRDPPAIDGRPISGTALEVAGLAMTDVLAQVEASRLLLGRSGLSVEEPWVGGLMAHLVAQAAFTLHEPSRMASLREFFDDLDPSRRADLRLSDYRLDLPFEEWIRYQGLFFEGALIGLGSDKRPSLKPILTKTRKKGGTIDAGALAKFSPALGRWIDTRR